MSRAVLISALLGIFGFFVLPWYGIEDGFFSLDWVPYYPMDPELAPALVQALSFGRPWLLPIALFVLAPLAVVARDRSDPGLSASRSARGLLIVGSLGLLFVVGQGLLIGPVGWRSAALEAWLGPLDVRQVGFGAGALVTTASFLLVFAEGLARRGLLRGDGFAASALTLLVASTVVFVLLPLLALFASAFETETGQRSLEFFLDNVFAGRTFGLGRSGASLGTAWRTLLLAVLASAGSTGLGLAFALTVTRTRTRQKRLIRGLTVLPIITPPFVVGLALILVFGRSGPVSMLLERFGVAESRWIFGLPGILIAELLAFTPIAFLVLIGVVEGTSPILEEAASTLGASPLRTFFTVTLPMLKPGLANAFLLCFIESIADFGNPLVLGGSWDVLSTQIFFAVAGAEHDLARAAGGSIALLAFASAAFFAQRVWLAGARYTSVTGKADSAAPLPLPGVIDRLVRCVSWVWALFTAAVYFVVLSGGFLKTLDRGSGLTLQHYAEMFALRADFAGPFPWFVATGAAWSSLGTTLSVALVSAPLTALVGLLTAWLLARRQFVGRGGFEALTMFSFAIPGTVVGVSYVVAFNEPPIDLAGTSALLVLCFVFRNMPVGLRAGLATFEQLDPSLEEASATLRSSTWVTMKRVVLPLLRPALIAALVFGFVRAMTAVSAVIFLVSADHDLATTYILGRVENGGYGPAIAYSSVLILLMAAAIAGIRWLVGTRDLGRREFLG